MTIRSRMIMLIMPLLVASVVTTGVLTASLAAEGIVRTTVKLLHFKANELSKQMYAQWDLLVRNGFAGDREYLNASRLTIESYADSLIMSETEIVFALDDSGRTAFSTRALNLQEDERIALMESAESRNSEWLIFNVDGAAMVGDGSIFEPFGWYVVVADRSTEVFSEFRRAIVLALAVLVASLGIGVAALLAISRHLTRPLQQVTSRIEEVIQKSEFTTPIEVDRSDELGQLARRFNYMASTLIAAKRKLTDLATVSTIARRRAADGERETLELLGRAAEYRDNETAAHVARVGRYAALLGSQVGLDERSARILLYSAPLHDIGKIGIPDTILFKAGELTAEEFEIVKSHTTIGYGILKDSRTEYLRAGATIALYHHEWFDGSGYPNGIKGSEIPLFARIVAVVDTFDAVTTNRPYKSAWTAEVAMELLKEEAGTHLDEELVKVFSQSVDPIRQIIAQEPDQSGN